MKQRIVQHTVERLFNVQQQHTGRKFCRQSRRYMSPLKVDDLSSVFHEISIVHQDIFDALLHEISDDATKTFREFYIVR
jgi:hypothetical protein